MITCKSPYRVSLSGGSTDYESFYSNYGSLLVGFAIDKYCYVSVKPLHSFDNVNYQVFYSKAERAERIEEIENPGVRGTLQYLKNNKIPNINKIAIYIQNDLPSQTGIGSSSCLIVALLQALYEMYKVEYTKKQLAKEAIYIERELLREPGGIQDQIWAAYGGVSTIHIDKSGLFEVKPLPVSEEDMQRFCDWSIMFCVNIGRKSYEIAKSHNNVSAKDSKLAILENAVEMEKAMRGCYWEDVGLLLNHSWQHKKNISSLISNPEIDEIYNRALQNGAFGGKLLGTGGGGFLYMVCDSVDKDRLIKSVNLPYLNVKAEKNGSRLIFKE